MHFSNIGNQINSFKSLYMYHHYPLQPTNLIGFLYLNLLNAIRVLMDCSRCGGRSEASFVCCSGTSLVAYGAFRQGKDKSCGVIGGLWSFCFVGVEPSSARALLLETLDLFGLNKSLRRGKKLHVFLMHMKYKYIDISISFMYSYAYNCSLLRTINYLKMNYICDISTRI